MKIPQCNTRSISSSSTLFQQRTLLHSELYSAGPSVSQPLCLQMLAARGPTKWWVERHATSYNLAYKHEDVPVPGESTPPNSLH
eukprot:3568878-Amphidinium_carterae.3